MKEAAIATIAGDTAVLAVVEDQESYVRKLQAANNCSSWLDQKQ